MEANEKQQAEALNFAMSVLQEMFPGLGLALIVFRFNDSGLGNYVSNAKRKDMITALRECADRLEKGQDFPTEGTN